MSGSPDPASGDFFATARKRRQQDQDFWRPIFQEFDRDMKMFSGDQWEQGDLNQRRDTNRPALSFPRLHTLVQLATNQIRQNPVSPKVNPVGEGATEETAKVLMGIMRHLNYQSQGDVARETAVEHSTAGGIGFYRIITDYADDDGFDQEILIRRILDPKTVLFDCAVLEPDFSDATHCFVEQRLTWEAYKAKYPRAKVQGFSATDDSYTWWDRDGITICEYWQCLEDTARLIRRKDGVSGVEGENGFDFDEKDVERERTIKRRRVVQDVINGVEKLSSAKWLGRWIPIIPVLGQEVVVEGKRKLISLIRHNRDAQRLLNAYKSGIAEAIGLTNRVPYIGPEGTFNTRSDWGNAHRTNPAILEYKPIILPNGQVAPAPQRQSAEAAIQALTAATLQEMDDIKAGAGYIDQVINPSQTDLSGVAVKRRQDQTSMVNFHFADNLMTRATWHEGRILLDLIPKVYDTARIQRIVGEDGTISTALITRQDENGGRPLVEGHEAERHHVLNAGRYEVTVAVGPSYQNRLEEELNFFTQLAQAKPDMWAAYADLYFKMRGYPDLEARAKALLPAPIQAQANGQQPIPPQMQAILAQNQALKAQMLQLLQERQAKMLDIKGKIEVALLNAQAGVIEADLKARAGAAVTEMNAELEAIKQKLGMLHEAELAPGPEAGSLGIHPQVIPQPQPAGPGAGGAP